MRQRSNRILLSLALAGTLSVLLAAVAMAATIVGDDGPNNLTGTAGKDRIFARGGDDTVNALAGRDRIRGGDGDDTLHGGRGRDRMSGGKGDDVQRGGAGRDRIFANPGVDESFGGPGNDVLWALARADVSGPGDTTGDTLHGQQGNDRFRVRDGERDVVDCGAGRDRVLADHADTVTTDCEIVKRAEPKPKRGSAESKD